MIVLVRHGEATHHTQHLTGGWTDSALTEYGQKQIQRTADSLNGYFRGKLLSSPLRILCSDLRRAKESAEIIAVRLGFTGVIEPYEFLREKCNGEAANKTEMEAKLLLTPPENGQALDHRNYPGSETRREFFQRSVNGLWQAVDMDKANIIIVAHKGTIQNIIFRWMGMDIEDVVRYKFSVSADPASISILSVNKWGEHNIDRLNYVNRR